MAYVNARPEKYGFELVYSTPPEYFAAIGAPGFGPASVSEDTHTQAVVEAADWPEYGGDFLPAAFSDHYVRSGFFTSRPASKASDRATWSATHSAKALEVLAAAAAGAPSASTESQLQVAIAASDAAVGVHQHPH